MQMQMQKLDITLTYTRLKKPNNPQNPSMQPNRPNPMPSF